MNAVVLVRAAFAYDADAVSNETGLECKDESMAVQAQKDEADINVIVRRFGVTGHLPVGVKLPTYADFEDVFDFQSAMDAVNAANRAFMSLDAELRMRFANDPQRFVAFCSDPANIDELVKLGLAEKKPEPVEVIQKVEIVNKEPTQ